eukprot:TRINITY_DN6624_c0_g1_i1.p1 TRINITY_DN6624_c0_g1~~TRINITY_DN6624_c0_g1_i1.p1  ORF type:complete len:493 (+),score=70.38 TRINITY_DN6624_c0_g1_i1:79-1557(+)
MQGELQSLFAILEREVRSGGEGKKQLVRRVGEVLNTKLEELEKNERLQPIIERRIRSAAATDGDYVVEDTGVLHLADQAMRDCGYVCHPHAGYPTYTQHISLPQSQDPPEPPPQPARSPELTGLNPPPPPPPEHPMSEVFVQPHRSPPSDISPRGATFDNYSPYPSAVAAGDAPAARIIGGHNKSLSPPIDRKSPRRISPTRMRSPVRSIGAGDVKSPTATHESYANCRSLSVERARRHVARIREQQDKSLTDDINFALGLKNTRLTDSKLNRALRVAGYRLDQVHNLQTNRSSRSPSRNQSPLRTSSVTTRRLFKDQSRQPRDVTSAYNESVKFAATLRLEMDPSQRSTSVKASRVRATDIAPRSSRRFNHVSNKGGGIKRKKKKSSTSQQNREPLDGTLEPQGASTSAPPHQYSPTPVRSGDHSQRHHSHVPHHVLHPPLSPIVSERVPSASPNDLSAAISNFVNHAVENGSSREEVYSTFQRCCGVAAQ